MIALQGRLDEGQACEEEVRTLVMPRRSERFLHDLRRPAEGDPCSAEPLRPRRMTDVTAETSRFMARSLRYADTCGVHQVLVVPGAGAPLVLAARRALLGGWAQGRGEGRAEGGREAGPGWLTPEYVAQAAGRAGVDLTRPVALLLIGVLHHVVADRGAGDLVDRLAADLARGSTVVVTHLSAEHPSAGLSAAVRAYERAGLPVRVRGRAQLGRLLAGLELAAPGVELLSSWRRDPRDGVAPSPELVACWGAVGRVR